MTKQCVGIDIVEMSRFHKFIVDNADQQLRQIFTEAEWSHCQTKKYPLQSLAARFAAKEACMKLFPRETALQMLQFSDFEIDINQYGAPYLKVNAQVQTLMEIYKFTKIHISISHTPSYACAVAMAES